MIGIIGNLCLATACFFSFLQMVLPIYGFSRNHIFSLASAKTSAVLQCFFVSAAYLFLTLAFVQSDFSLIYVAQNSHESLPFIYRFTAVWGGHEGSILLWILILNIWTQAFIFYSRAKKLPLSVCAMILAILGLINICFLFFLYFTSNPFESTSTILTGKDLNPLLQDPGFLIHPPMLYAGYVGFAVSFAIVQGALIAKQLTGKWLQAAAFFAVSAWCFLTLGILLGSLWAYRVLGWGGFWFWDPVENASLLPWLTGTAFIHVLILANKKNIFKNWTALLALICFSLSLLGTFLVRSGVLISAHTFANDPKRGMFLLIILAFLATLALSIYLWRKPNSEKPTVQFHFWSREMGLLINSTLLIISMLTILLGTLYPLILDTLSLGTVSVGAPYFNTVMLPLICFTMIWMGAIPYFSWEKYPLKLFWQKARLAMLISIIIASIILFCFAKHFDWQLFLALSLCVWIILSVISSFKLLPSMSFAHIGFAVLIMGILLSTLLNQEREVRIKPGEKTTVGPYQFYFIQTKRADGENYRGIQALFDVMKNHHYIAALVPEKRIYNVRDIVMTKVDIHPGIFRDLYIALGEPLEEDYWSVRIYYKPFIRFIWIGGAMMIIGGLLALRKSMRIKLTYFVPFIILIVLFGFLYRALIVSTPHVSPPTEMSMSMPSFSIPDLFSPNTELTEKTLQGRVVLLNIWATWCDACQFEHDMLLTIQQQYHIPIYSINYKDDPEQARTWLSEHGNPFVRTGSDQTGETAVDFGIYGTPETFIIDKTGKIVYRHIGVITSKDWEDTLYPLIHQLESH